MLCPFIISKLLPNYTSSPISRPKKDHHSIRNKAESKQNTESHTMPEGARVFSQTAAGTLYKTDNIQSLYLLPSFKVFIKL